MGAQPWTIRPLADPEAIPLGERTSPFQARWGDTVDLAARELRALKAENVVLELEVTESQLRIDGGIRADARPATCRVRLSFDSRRGPLRFATGQFGNDALDLGWKWNVRAIALGLEALRRVDRYGITESGEQYTGWRQLTADGGTLGISPAQQAAATLVELAGQARAGSEAGMGGTDVEAVDRVLARGEDMRALYRVAARRLHPDHTGGAPTPDWGRLQDARAVLDRHHRTSP